MSFIDFCIAVTPENAHYTLTGFYLNIKFFSHWSVEVILINTCWGIVNQKGLIKKRKKKFVGYVFHCISVMFSLRWWCSHPFWLSMLVWIRDHFYAHFVFDAVTFYKTHLTVNCRGLTETPRASLSAQNSRLWFHQLGSGLVSWRTAQMLIGSSVCGTYWRSWSDLPGLQTLMQHFDARSHSTRAEIFQNPRLNGSELFQRSEKESLMLCLIVYRANHRQALVPFTSGCLIVRI